MPVLLSPQTRLAADKPHAEHRHITARSMTLRVGVCLPETPASDSIPNMKRAAVGGLVIILLTSACSGSEGSSNLSGAQPAPDTPVTAVQASLQASCPQVEAGLPKGLIPAASKWQTFADDLKGIAAAGDAETKNAVDNLQEAVAVLAADPEGGLPLLDARQALRDSVSNLATRCAAVGSSALQ